jgi:hypothetical protein
MGLTYVPRTLRSKGVHRLPQLAVHVPSLILGHPLGDQVDSLDPCLWAIILIGFINRCAHFGVSISLRYLLVMFDTLKPRPFSKLQPGCVSISLNYPNSCVIPNNHPIPRSPVTPLKDWAWNP